jgi:hypothetical protein
VDQIRPFANFFTFDRPLIRNIATTSSLWNKGGDTRGQTERSHFLYHISVSFDSFLLSCVVSHFNLFFTMGFRSFRSFFAMSTLSTCLLGQLITGLLGSLGLGCSPPEQALLACKAISDLDVPTLIWPVSDLNPDYTYAKDHYWNNANAQFTPACVVLPTCATHVSHAVQVLSQYSDVNFAVKSGGHNANVGFSSTDGGVLIYFKNMNQTTLSWDELMADVQPGARWENAIQALEPYSRTVVGGRVGM